MATSGNTLKEISMTEIVDSALRKCGVLEESQTANTDQFNTAAIALNALVAEFRTLGMQVWARTSTLVTLVNGQKDYTFGVGQTINTPYPMYIYSIELQIPPYDTQISLNQMAITDFNLLPVGSTGTPVQYTYQPLVNVGTLSIWPTPDTSVPAGSRMHITYQRPIEVFDVGANTPDFPQEWGNALIYGLAFLIGDEYGVPEQRMSRIEKLANTHLNTVLGTANEQGSLYIQPAYQFRNR